MAKIYGMDVYFVLNGIKFVWNEEKARINPINHDGVTFQQAAEAFFDPFLVERENDLVRIISARKATRKEYEYYEN